MKDLLLIFFFVNLLLLPILTILNYDDMKKKKAQEKQIEASYSINQRNIINDVDDLMIMRAQSKNNSLKQVSMTYLNGRFYGNVFSFGKSYVVDQDQNMTLHIEKIEKLPKFEEQCVLFFQYLKRQNVNISSLTFEIDVDHREKFNKNEIKHYCQELNNSHSAFITLK